MASPPGQYTQNVPYDGQARWNCNRGGESLLSDRRESSSPLLAHLRAGGGARFLCGDTRPLYAPPPRAAPLPSAVHPHGCPRSFGSLPSHAPPPIAPRTRCATVASSVVGWGHKTRYAPPPRAAPLPLVLSHARFRSFRSLPSHAPPLPSPRALVRNGRANYMHSWHRYKDKELSRTERFHAADEFSSDGTCRQTRARSHEQRHRCPRARSLCVCRRRHLRAARSSSRAASRKSTRQSRQSDLPRPARGQLHDRSRPLAHGHAASMKVETVTAALVCHLE